MPEALTQVESLTLIALTDRSRYGYEMVQRIAELTDERVSLRPGNLYRVLHRLQERGLVCEPAGARSTGVDPRRRYFALTAAGKRAVAAELAMYRRVLQRTGIPAEGGAGG